MKQYITILLLILLCLPAAAQENMGARPMGMGGAFSGLADDVSAIFVNPAGISSIPKESMMVSSRIAEDREFNIIGGVENTRLGAFGIGYVGATDPVSTGLAPIIGSTPVKYYTQTLYLTYARELSQAIRVPKNMGQLSLGLNVKYSSRKLGNANGLSSDAGSNLDIDIASVFRPNASLSIGLSLQNMMNGKNSSLQGVSAVEDTNRNVLFGVSGKLIGDRITWAVEGDELGCEYKAAKGLSLRAGRGKESVTSGFGIIVGGIAIDYAYLQKTSPVHYISVSLLPKDPPAPTQTAAIDLQ